MKWFKHETDSLRNSKVRKVIRTHGATGYAIWFALLEKLYEAEGEFQVKADDLWLEDLADDLKLSDYRTLIRVFDTFAECGLISSQLWNGEQIICCDGITERGDAYIEKRIKETEKKRRQRAKNNGLSPGDKNGTRGQSADVPLSEIRDQNSEIRKKEGIEKSLPPSPPPQVISVDESHPVAQTEKRFQDAGKSDLPWVLSMANRYNPEYDTEMLESTIEHLRTTPSFEKIAPTNADAKKWLAGCHFPGNPGYEKRMTTAYIVWESAQSLKRRKAAQQPQQSEAERMEILNHLYRRYGGVPAA